MTSDNLSADMLSYLRFVELNLILIEYKSENKDFHSHFVRENLLSYNTK